MHTPDFSVSALPATLRGLYFIWSTAQSDGHLPHLNAINLAQTIETLDWLVITEVLRSENTGQAVDFRFLYTSPNMRGALFAPYMGKTLSSMPGKGPSSRIWAAYSAIARDGRPLRVQLPYTGPSVEILETDEIFLPLGDGGREVRQVLVGISRIMV